MSANTARSNRRTRWREKLLTSIFFSISTIEIQNDSCKSQAEGWSSGRERAVAVRYAADAGAGLRSLPTGTASGASPDASVRDAGVSHPGRRGARRLAGWAARFRWTQRPGRREANRREAGPAAGPAGRRRCAAWEAEPALGVLSSLIARWLQASGGVVGPTSRRDLAAGAGAHRGYVRARRGPRHRVGQRDTTTSRR